MTPKSRSAEEIVTKNGKLVKATIQVTLKGAKTIPLLKPKCEEEVNPESLIRVQNGEWVFPR